MILYTFAIILIVSHVSTAVLSAGSPCSPDANTQGICRPLRVCSAAQRIIRNGGRPKICSFIKNEPIVCCPEEITSSRIHIRKCKEYGKQVFKYTRQPIPILNAPYSNVSLCNIVAQPLLVSGMKTTNKEFPHMALIGYGRDENLIKWFCDGSLISDRYILTSAECVEHNVFGQAQYVRLGNSERDRKHETEIQYFKVVEWIKHPKYKAPSRYNDIGLLKLNTSALVSSLVRPACLFDRNESPNLLIASGLGGMGPNSVSSKDLQKVILQLYPHDKCSSSYQSHEFENELSQGILEDTQICAGSGQFGEDICERFSGGPLQVYHDEVYCMYSILGIRSFYNTCESSNHPGIYTRVSAYVSWIESIVWKDS